MKKHFEAYNSLPTAEEGRIDKVVVPVAISLAALALVVTGANVVKNNAADTMDENMGNSISEQFTGEARTK